MIGWECGGCDAQIRADDRYEAVVEEAAKFHQLANCGPLFWVGGEP